MLGTWLLFCYENIVKSTALSKPQHMVAVVSSEFNHSTSLHCPRKRSDRSCYDFVWSRQLCNAFKCKALGCYVNSRMWIRLGYIGMPDTWLPFCYEDIVKSTALQNRSTWLLTHRLKSPFATSLYQLSPKYSTVKVCLPHLQNFDELHNFNGLFDSP